MRTFLLFSYGIFIALFHNPILCEANDVNNSFSAYSFVPIVEAGQEFEVLEGSPTGTAVGTVAASDAQSITGFAITDADALSTGTPPNDSPINALAMFTIDNNGQITVNDPTYLLAVVGPIRLTIEVTNTQSEKSSADVQVNINDKVVQTSLSQGLSWSTGTPQPLGNSEGQSEVVNGKLYSFSGFDIEKRPSYTPTERVYVYDPQLDSWTLLNPMPKMHPNSAHGGVTHAGFTTDGANIYFAGGYAASANGNGQIFGTKYVYKYIVASDSYERLPDLPLARASGGLEYIDGKLYYVGGENAARNEDQGDLFVLDLHNLNAGWTNLTDSPLPNPRNHLGSAVINGKLYVVGGQHQKDNNLTTQDDVHMFDPATETWTKVTDLPDIDEVPDNLTPGKGHITNATFAYDNKIFVLGGEYQFLGPYSKSVLAYNPAANEWIRYSDMPTVRSSGIAGIVDGVMYYSTGRNSSTTYRTPIGSTTSQKGIWLEAECSEVGSNWIEVEDSEASGGSYVVVPNLNSYSPPSDVPANRVRFTFSLDDGGKYHLFARLRAPTSGDDSFFIRINGGNWVQWWENISTGSTFNWNEVEGSPLTLNSGNNIIDIAYRENGAQLDKLHLNQSGLMPGGIGEGANNCEGSSENQAPTAQLTVDNEAGTAPLTVTFSGSSSSDDQGIVKYSWDFGDGTTGSGETVNHTYENAGEYTAKLTVADAEGLEGEATVKINVNSPTSDGGIWLEAECGEVGNNWNTESLGEASAGSYLTIRSGLNSYGAAPSSVSSHVSFTFTAPQAGDYHLYARVRAPSGADDSFWVRVDGGNWLQWNVAPRTGTFDWRKVSGLMPNFAAGSSHTLDVAYREDGTDLDKLFLSISSALPAGLGEAADNCGDSPNEAPLASVSADIQSGTAPLTVTFSGSSSSDDQGIVSYSWDFGDGTTGSGETVNHTYENAGEYTAKLTVADAEGLEGQATININVNSPTSVQEVWLEAECGEVGSNWIVALDGAASGGNYVVVPNLNSYSPPSDIPSNRIRFTFLLSEGGSYYLFARVRAPSSSDDSFFIRINGGSWIQWWQNMALGNSFNWNETAGSPFNFVAGENTIDMAYRESGTQLDKLHLNLTGSLPSGVGESASNCNGEINNKDEVLSLRAYPNALEDNNFLKVQSSKSFSPKVEASLIDQTGRILLENVQVNHFNASTISLDFSTISLKQGVYFLSIKEDKFTRPQLIRFIKK
ncbi:PKD domain-containing protein [Catalinimonas sp. 4WD22]|uniref:PKD domain-containing protein n=1 Tax=Catalinimonas locisalis TaxID=3133978 RepID=UPI003100E529